MENMIQPTLIFKGGKGNAADFNNGRNAVWTSDNAFYHGIDPTTQFFEFPVSTYRYHSVQMAVGNGGQIFNNAVNAVHSFSLYQVIQKNQRHSFYQQQIQKSIENLLPEFFKQRVPGQGSAN